MHGLKTRADEITWATRLRWIALALVPSSYLLGVTTYITTDVAAVPLLWVLPLTIYLLTFILAFAKRPPVPHRAFVYALPTTALAVAFFLLSRAALPVGVNVGLHLLAFFVAAMVCHGELRGCAAGAASDRILSADVARRSAGRGVQCAAGAGVVQSRVGVSDRDRTGGVALSAARRGEVNCRRGCSGSP